MQVFFIPPHTSPYKANTDSLAVCVYTPEYICACVSELIFLKFTTLQACCGNGSERRAVLNRQSIALNVCIPVMLVWERGPETTHTPT